MNNPVFSGPSPAFLALVLLGAASVMAFGIWRGRPDLGGRAFWWVVLSSALLSVLSAWMTFRPLGMSSPLTLWMLGGGVLAHLLGAVPLWIALRWMQTIKDATEAPRQA